MTSVGTPKAGVFAEGQASVVAEQIAAGVRGGARPAAYGGRGICYIELGRHQVARVDVPFVSGRPPTGTIDGPSQEPAADKAAFGTSRIGRWFDLP